MHKMGRTASALRRALRQPRFVVGQVARGNCQIHYEARKTP